eukprot:g9009.t1
MTCSSFLQRIRAKIGVAGATMLMAAFGMILGVVLRASGHIPSDNAIALLSVPGRMWLFGLRCAVLPLIICSVMISMQSIKKLRSGSFLIGATIAFYLFTTLLAAMGALFWFYFLLSKRLHYVPYEEFDDQPDTPGSLVDQIVLILESLIPNNLITAYASNNVMGLIIVTISVGMLIDDTEDRPSVLMALARELNDIIMKIMEALIKLTPIAVFFLVLPQSAALDLAEVGEALGFYLLTLFLAFLMHAAVVLPAVYFVFTRKNPYQYLYRCTEAFVTAFATSSSAASLPVTMRCVVQNNDVDENIAAFTLPLGATINMNGTCINLVMAILWMAAAQGEPLGVPSVVILVLLSILSSVGTAPVPNASLIMILIILETLDVSTTSLFALYTAIDWLPDRFRSVINIMGDALVSGIVQHLVGKNGGLMGGLLETSLSNSSFNKQFGSDTEGQVNGPKQTEDVYGSIMSRSGSSQVDMAMHNVSQQQPQPPPLVVR